MAKYDKKSQDKVEETMHEMKEGTLKSGSGKKVTSRKQAIAIGLSIARKEGSKAPKKKSSTKKTGRKKSASTKRGGKSPSGKSAKSGRKISSAKRNTSSKKGSKRLSKGGN